MSDSPKAACPVCLTKGALGDVCTEHGRFRVAVHDLEHAPSDHLLGEWLGDKYAILGILGSGAVGTVYWGIQHPIGRRCAIKVLRHEVTDGNGEKQRFLREAQAIVRMNHPHVITCYDYGSTQSGIVYMVLEFLEGMSLNHLLDSTRLEAPQITWFVRQILEGISAFHKANIVHRDIKPSNVMICQANKGVGFVKIIDFGLVRYLQPGGDSKPITRHGEILGTPVYMSPEQALGDSRITQASDIYAFGTVLYQMLTGHPPFESTTILELLLSHVEKPVPPIPPIDEDSDCPDALREFVYTCLSKDPNDRFDNGIEALTAFLALDLPERGLNPTLATAEPSAAAKVPSAGMLQLDLDDALIQMLGSTRVKPTRAALEVVEPDLGSQWKKLIGATAHAFIMRVVRVAQTSLSEALQSIENSRFGVGRGAQITNIRQTLLERHVWFGVCVGLFSVVATPVVRALFWVGRHIRAVALFIWRTHQALAERLVRGIDAAVDGDTTQKIWRSVSAPMRTITLPIALMVGNMNFIVAVVGFVVLVIVRLRGG